MTSVTGIDFIKNSKIGWNAGNSLDAFTDKGACETAWHNPLLTAELINNVVAEGFDVIRIPITWLGHIGDAPEYKIDEKWLKRVKEVVDYAVNTGVKVIINIHHDGADSKHWLNIKEAVIDPAKNKIVTDELCSVWRQIAEYFESYDENLVFETMNEIHDGGWGHGENLTDDGKQYKVLNDWNQAVVTTIRETGGNNAERFIGVPGYVTNAALTMEHFVLPKDTAKDKLLLSVHYYDPFNFACTQEIKCWGKQSGAPIDLISAFGQEDDAEKVFSALKEKFIDNGIPVYMGEYGSVIRKEPEYEKYRLYYMEYVTKAMQKYEILPVYWDNGDTIHGFGLFNRFTGKTTINGKKVIEVMMK